MSTIEQRERLNRRAFLRQGALILAGPLMLRASAAMAAAAPPAVRLGLLTDLHYADRPPMGTRYYRETPDKLAEAIDLFRRDTTDAVVELGDLVDAADTPSAERGYLARMAKELSAAPGQCHFVVGNHCVYTLTKEEFLETVQRPRTYYSFDLANYHFVVLDACFRQDGVAYGRKNSNWMDANVPPSELEWLASDLKATTRKTVVFVHQRLDLNKLPGIRNSAEVRKILDQSGKVLAVIQGHYHHNFHCQIGDIHYCTLAAMIEGTGKENNAYGRMDIFPDDTIRIAGFRKQQSYQWQHRAATTG